METWTGKRCLQKGGGLGIAFAVEGFAATLATLFLVVN
jgi:hypothetical protein